MVSIEIAKNSSGGAVQAVKRFLRKSNLQARADLKIPDQSDRELLLVAKDSRRILGGLIATTRHKWLRISIMAVAPSHRGQGLGSLLVRKAEALACGRGCWYAYVDTMSYQAPAFYRKLGYRQTGALRDWDSAGHNKLFFVKRLKR